MFESELTRSRSLTLHYADVQSADVPFAETLEKLRAPDPAISQDARDASNSSFTVIDRPQYAAEAATIAVTGLFALDAHVRPSEEDAVWNVGCAGARRGPHPL